MTETSRTPRPSDLTIAGNGSAPEPAAAHYCGFCGQAVAADRAVAERFGERFCSEAHAEEFVQGVRAARVRAAAAAEALPIEAQDVEVRPDTPKPSTWKMAAKMAVCCGAPLLALVVLAGGGGALLGAAGALLPLLAFLACPLAMLFMMWGMNRAGRNRDDKGRDEPRER